MIQEKHLFNHAQSKVFARAIYADISDYIEANQEEYLKFTAESECENESEIESPH